VVEEFGTKVLSEPESVEHERNASMEVMHKMLSKRRAKRREPNKKESKQAKIVKFRSLTLNGDTAQHVAEEGEQQAEDLVAEDHAGTSTSVPVEDSRALLSDDVEQTVHIDGIQSGEIDEKKAAASA
jgi:hypothetical protein